MKTKEQIIHDMCLTARHDYGLPSDSSPFGLTDEDKQHLWNTMSQQYEHNIRPLVHELEELYNGYRLVMPSSSQHAENMIRVAQFYLDNKNDIQ